MAGVSQAILEFHGVVRSQTEIAAYGAEGQNTWNYLYGSGSNPTRRGVDLILNHFAGIAGTGLSSALSQSVLAGQIGSGRPPVIRWGWDSGGGHHVVARGIEGDTVYLMDPWSGPTINSYSWVSRGGGHTWTHTLRLDTSPTLAVSGHVRTAGGSGMSGVSMDGLPATPTTDGGGYYSAIVPFGWTRVVTPGKAGYTFDPPSRSYTDVSGQLPNQDYIGAPSEVLWGASTGLFFPSPDQGILTQPGDAVLAQLYLAPDGNIDAEILSGGGTNGDDMVLDSVVVTYQGTPPNRFARFEKQYNGPHQGGILYGVVFASASPGVGERYYRGPGQPAGGPLDSYDLNTNTQSGDSWNGTVHGGSSMMTISWLGSQGFIDNWGNPILPNVGDEALIQLIHAPDGEAKG